MLSLHSDIVKSKNSPLHSLHESLGARFTDFGGWNLPLCYSSILEEHKHVRTQAGIFDTSHMGEILCEGNECKAFIDHLICNDLSKITAGRCLYTPILYPDGNVVDDVIVYLFSPQKAILVVNASNVDKDLEWMKEINTQGGFGVEISNVSDSYAMLAVQGPKARSTIEDLFPETKTMKPFHFREEIFEGEKLIFSTTGYTGESGGEFYLPHEGAEDLFRRFLDRGVLPCGLGARDSLRLEKRYSLYGHEISKQINPLEAGLGWTVAMKKKDFVGKEALENLSKKGLRRKMVGFVIEERGVARQGHSICSNGEVIGEVTSGSFSPILGKGIGLGFVPRDFSGADIAISVRGKELLAKIQKGAFV